MHVILVLLWSSHSHKVFPFPRDTSRSKILEWIWDCDLKGKHRYPQFRKMLKPSRKPHLKLLLLRSHLVSHEEIIHWSFYWKITLQIKKRGLERSCLGPPRNCFYHRRLWNIHKYLQLLKNLARKNKLPKVRIWATVTHPETVSPITSADTNCSNFGVCLNRRQ